MERTFAGDLKYAAALLGGVALACLFGIADWDALLGAAIGVAIVTAIVNVARARARQRD